MAESKISGNGWVRLALTRSQSDPSKMYVLGMRLLKTGKTELGCDCPSRIYRKGVKPSHGFDVTCKHIRNFLDCAIPMADLDLTPEGAAFLIGRNAGMAKALADAVAKVLADAKAKKAAAAVADSTLAG